MPANIGFDGVVYVGAKGDLHFSIAEKHPEGAPFQGLGFVTPAGRYLDRSQALEWVRENENSIKSSLNVQGELDALDYREQVFFSPDLGGLVNLAAPLRDQALFRCAPRNP